MAPAVELFAVKVLRDDGSGTVSALIAGIDWSVKNGMQVVNMSLSTATDSQSLRLAVDNAYAAGVLLIAAAGNSGTADGSGDTVRFPARYDSVIAVAATDRHNVRASFSATGSTLELSAPGVIINSTLPDSRFGNKSGRSMAAPHVAGAAALVWAANPSLTNREIREALRDSALALGDANHFGRGLINPSVALFALTPAPTPEPSPEPQPSPEPEPLRALALTVTTDKPAYSINERVLIRIAATRGDTVVAGESLNVVVIRPNGKIAARYSLTSGQDGQATAEFRFRRNDRTGEYRVQVTGACGTEAQTWFVLR